MLREEVKVMLCMWVPTYVSTLRIAVITEIIHAWLQSKYSSAGVWYGSPTSQSNAYKSYIQKVLFHFSRKISLISRPMKSQIYGL